MFINKVGRTLWHLNWYPSLGKWLARISATSLTWLEQSLTQKQDNKGLIQINKRDLDFSYLSTIWTFLPALFREPESPLHMYIHSPEIFTVNRNKTATTSKSLQRILEYIYSRVTVFIPWKERTILFGIRWRWKRLMFTRGIPHCWAINPVR